MTTPDLTPTPMGDDTVRVNRETVTDANDAGAVVVDMRTLSYIELDRVGAAMWRALVESGTVSGAIESLLAQFDADRAILETDLARFVVRLRDIGLIDAEHEGPPATPAAPDTAADRYLDLLERAVSGFLSTTGMKHAGHRAHGRDVPPDAVTMIGLVRLRSLRALAERALADNVPGDFVETGVWRGGATILMRGVLAAHQVTDRSVWVVDSFAGLPMPDVERFPVDEFWTPMGGRLVATLDDVRANFASYLLLDDQVKFLQGWFKDTLPTAPIERIAVLRLDGDLYESTMDSLNNLYHRVSPGGFVIIDDYNLESCRIAVDEFRATHDITAEIGVIDWAGVWWQVPPA